MLHRERWPQLPGYGDLGHGATAPVWWTRTGLYRAFAESDV